MNGLRANLYQALAEALAEPDEWLTLPGREWPLYDAALQLASDSEAARRAVLAMMEIREENLEQRQERYAALFAGQNRPLIWIYESGAIHGRLFSENTFEVEQWYRAAKLDIVGAELPDHASLELAFLAHLSGAEQEEFSRFERDFLQCHALRWLPALGRALALSGDTVYSAIGQLLADWLEELTPNRRRPMTSHQTVRRFPNILPDQVDNCILCGFCSQICPTRALVIHENQQVTALQLSAQRCVGCGQCVRVCEPHVLGMGNLPADQEHLQEWRTLRDSSRPTCKTCGKPLISKAELAYVADRLGDPTWLELCQDCRTGF